MKNLNHSYLYGKVDVFIRMRDFFNFLSGVVEKESCSAVLMAWLLFLTMTGSWDRIRNEIPNKIRTPYYCTVRPGQKKEIPSSIVRCNPLGKYKVSLAQLNDLDELKNLCLKVNGRNCERSSQRWIN